MIDRVMRHMVDRLHVSEHQRTSQMSYSSIQVHRFALNEFVPDRIREHLLYRQYQRLASQANAPRTCQCSIQPHRYRSMLDIQETAAAVSVLVGNLDRIQFEPKSKVHGAIEGWCSRIRNQRLERCLGSDRPTTDIGNVIGADPISRMRYGPRPKFATA